MYKEVPETIFYQWELMTQLRAQWSMCGYLLEAISPAKSNRVASKLEPPVLSAGLLLEPAVDRGILCTM
jgi:hypothetical protein